MPIADDQGESAGMIEKPEFLGPVNATAFQEPAVAAAYRHRCSYPLETFTILAGLITDEPRAVLDAGCGTGDIARGLAPLVERVDAVDFSKAMIEVGKMLSGGDDPRLVWMCGRVEDIPLQPPYALITAGQSLHWMDWNVVLPYFRDALTPCGYVALVDVEESRSPWGAGVDELIRRYSTIRDFQPYDMVAAWTQHGLWRAYGKRQTAPVRFEQSVESYIESFHARSSLTRERLGRERALAFDAELRDLVAPFACHGMVVLEVAGVVSWGRPGE